MLGCGHFWVYSKVHHVHNPLFFFPLQKIKLYKGGANSVAPIKADCTTSIFRFFNSNVAMKMYIFLGLHDDLLT